MKKKRKHIQRICKVKTHSIIIKIFGCFTKYVFTLRYHDFRGILWKINFPTNIIFPLISHEYILFKSFFEYCSKNNIVFRITQTPYGSIILNKF